MKKSLFILMAIAMVFVGCKKTEPNSNGGSKGGNESVEAIEISKHKLLFAMNDTVVSDPVLLEEVSGKTVSWRSSDPAVASVRGGLVSPVGLGSCLIIAELGGATDTCRVLVDTELPPYEAFEPSDWGLFGNFQPIEGQDTVELTFSDGDTLDCVKKQITMYMWDKNIEYISGQGMVGSGMMVLGTVRVYVIVEEGKYNGYYVGAADGFIVTPEDSVWHGSVIEGKIADNYAELAADYWNKAWHVTEENYDSVAASAARDAYDASVTGAFVLEYNDGFYYPFLSILTSGRFDNLDIDETNPDLGTWFAYDLNFDWFDNDELTQFGLRGDYVTDENGDTVDWAFLQPLQLTVTSANYKNYDFPALEEDEEEEEAPRYKIIDPARIHEGVDPIKNWKRVDLKTLRTK